MGSEQIDWNTAMVHEKLDGNLCVLFHYSGKWIVSSKGTVSEYRSRAKEEEDEDRELEESGWWNREGMKRSEK